MRTPNSGAALDIGWSKVSELHRLCGFPIGDIPSALHPNRVAEWARWLTEEINEFAGANSIEDQADALMDLIYFALGAFVEMGVPPQKIFELVHEANLAKGLAKGKMECDANGKLVKPVDWIAPQREIQIFIADLIAQSVEPRS